MLRWVVGIDEVGRGALAGPVVVAAAAVPRGLALRNRALGPLKDSKKLSRGQREAWLLHFNDLSDPRNGADRMAFAVARVYPRQIEKRNISRAANAAAERAFLRLCVGETAGSAGVRCRIFLDGGLFLGNGGQPKNARTVIKGDEKIAAVAAASIIAKVYRDRLMRRLAKKYPAYGFDVHKGYGTRRTGGRSGSTVPARRIV